MVNELSIFSGTSNPQLAAAVAQALGVPLGSAVVDRFPDGEVTVQLEEPVRRKDVFIIQPTSPPVNDHLVELLAFADACRRASAAQITAVVPYFGYARADKRHGRREPITASMVAVLLQAVGINHVITIDLHASQIEGFFHIAVDGLTAVPLLCDAIGPRLPADTVLVSPDAGRLAMATDYAQRLQTAVVLLHKTRDTGAKTHVTHLVGDVRRRTCLIVDDMIATGGTLVESIGTLLDAGARSGILIAATHALWLEGARERLAAAPVADVFVTDTVAQPAAAWAQLRVVPVTPLVAGAIQRLVAERSLSDLF
ncbi:MAG: ribose-phosphate diphosphokinase [Vicinamibacteraceae bacterium]